MLYAIAAQLGQAYGPDASTARQIMLVPATGAAWGRTVSDAHPRRTWQPLRYTDPSAIIATAPVRADRIVDGPWIPCTDNWWAASGLPLFHITDEEARAMQSEAVMPRNVALRYQRALEATGAVLVGKGALPLADVARSSAVGIESRRLLRMDGSAALTGREQLLRELDELAADIRRNAPGLGHDVPQEARAKGAGPARSADEWAAMLGGASDPSFPPPRPLKAPAPPESLAPAPEAAPEAAPAAVPGIPSEPVSTGQLLKRPNGAPYYARPLDIGVKGACDVELIRGRARRGVHCLLGGRPGTGKTALLEVALPNMVTVLGNAETEAPDLLGQYVVTLDAEGREVLSWMDGPVTVAALSGRPVFIDEIGVIPQKQLTTLFDLMDGRRSFRIPHNPARGELRVADGFVVVAAYNPGISGPLNEAIMSRFGFKTDFTTDYDTMLRMGVNPRAVEMARHMSKLVDSDAAGWAPESRDLLAFKDDEEDLGLHYAIRQLLKRAPEAELPVVEAAVRERWGDVPKIAGIAKAMRI